MATIWPMGASTKYNRRHNAVNFALYLYEYEAVAAVAVAIGAVVLGDKGASEETRRTSTPPTWSTSRNWGGYDNTGNDCLHKTKCISSHKKSHALGPRLSG
jgi:hypothetical protein